MKHTIINKKYLKIMQKIRFKVKTAYCEKNA
jgi:hypothetical protein